MRYKVLGIALGVSIFLAATQVFAAGYYLPGLGTRSFGRGAAYIVGGTEPTVMWTNVANIAALKGLQVRADLELVYLDFSFLRAPDNRHFEGYNPDDPSQSTPPPYRYKMPEDGDNPTWEPNTDAYPPETTYKKVENQALPFPVPLFMVTYDLGLENIVMSIGGYGPPRGSYELPEWGPQRYSLVDQSMWQAIIQLSVAGEFLNGRLRVGLGFQYIRSWFTQKIHLAAPAPELIASTVINDLSEDDYRKYDYYRTLDPALDVEFEVSPVDDVNFGATMGFWANPWAGLVMGASVQTPTDLRATGEFEVKIPKAYSDYVLKIGRIGGIEFSDPIAVRLDTGAKVSGNTLDVYLTMPWIVRSGIGWQQTDQEGKPWFDVEVAFVYEFWSMHRNVEINPRDVVIKLDPEMKDSNPFVSEDMLNKLRTNVSLGTIVQAKALQDAWSLRIGGDYHLIPDMLTLRAGYFFETSGIPDESYSVDLIDGDKHGFAVGGTFSRWGVDFDFAFGFIYLPQRVVTNSKRYAIDPISVALHIPGNEDIPVANGTYNAYYVVGSIGVTLHVDEWFGMHKAGKGLTKKKLERDVIEPVKEKVKKIKERLEQKDESEPAAEEPQGRGGTNDEK